MASPLTFSSLPLTRSFLCATAQRHPALFWRGRPSPLIWYRVAAVLTLSMTLAVQALSVLSVLVVPV